jgi:hypothetical protein
VVKGVTKMWISATQFQRLIERLVLAEEANKDLQKELEIQGKRIERLSDAVVEIQASPTKNTSKELEAREIFDQLMHGVPDPETKKVKWTDGR